MNTIVSAIRSNWNLSAVYISNLLFTLHFSLVIYINSTFLNQFFSTSMLGLLYTIGSIISIVFLLKVPQLLKRYGNYRLAISFILLELLAVVGMAILKNPYIIAILFVVHQTVTTMIIFNLDIFLENIARDETKTGGVRGLYLTLSSAMVVIAPITVGYILTDGDFSKVYLLSSLILVPLLYFIRSSFKHFKDSIFRHAEIIAATKEFLANKDIYNIFMAKIILQFFYVWMIIYLPPYLKEVIGFEWSEIGIMFTIMLLPFIIFTLPIGKIADTKLGEKEILFAGFIIMAISSGLLSFITTPNFMLWTSALFLTRIGASFVEITTESYFFKQVNDENPEAISLFRIAWPIAFVIAPLIALIVLKFLDIQYLFFILGFIVLFGIKHALLIKDTK